MTASIENIVQHLFHQPTLQDVSVDELYQMTQEYPSFAAARFLLLKKMQDTGHPNFSSQLHKTAVYFNNPLWLQLLLTAQKDTANGWQPSKGYTQPPELPGTEQEQDHEPVPEQLPEAEQPLLPAEPEPVQAQEPLAVAESPLMQEVLDRLRGHIHEANHDGQEPQPVQEPAEASASPLMQEVLDRLRGQIHEAGDVEEQHWPADTDAPAHDTVAAELQEEIIPPVSSQEATEGMHEAIEQFTTPVAQIPAEIAAQDDQPKEEDFAPPFHDPEPVTTAAPEPVEAPEPLAPTLEAYTTTPVAEEPLLIKTIIETPSAQQDILFEPYHTIDYFASLGIRLDKMEPNPQDKLGKQLRSFTEWLKSMKKLPQASIEKVLGENEESAVVAAASHSVVGKDIITEAMAEVFEKQGLYEKAIGVYLKLSLLNPSKSAYFADRINALKRQ